MKNTLIIGASTNQDRYSYRAAHLLVAHGHKILNYGVKKGMVAGVEIINNQELPKVEIDTVTLYVGEEIQKLWFDFILKIHPKRVIFNPGTENYEFYRLLNEAHIPHEEACTLVLLQTGQY
ncbi:MAG: CoA-binding protein [Cytophagales bacterium]